MIRAFFAVTALLLLLISCKKTEKPADVMKDDQMQAVLWDVLQANAYVNEYLRKDSGRNIEQEQVKLQQQVFAKHKITKAGFDKSYNWYLEHPVQMQVMIDTMIARSNRNKKTKLLQPDRQAE